jgi:hypothetical protein
VQLTPAQSTIAVDRHRFRVVDAGRRFGKTTLAAWEMFADWSKPHVCINPFGVYADECERLLCFDDQGRF